MTTLTLFKALIEICVILLVCVGIYNEKSFMRFDFKRKAGQARRRSKERRNYVDRLKARGFRRN